MVNKMLAGGLAVGGFVAFLLSIISAVFVFDAPAPDSTAFAPEIELGMQVLPTEQQIEVWMDAIIPLRISVSILNISKIDNEDGSSSPGGIVDLFPIDSPSTGTGTVIFKIRQLDAAEMPDLASMNHEVIPFAFIKRETLTNIVRSVLKLSAVGLMFWKFMLLGAIGGGLGLIVVGAGLLYMGKKK